jgi:hypothetical protein
LCARFLRVDNDLEGSSLKGPNFFTSRPKTFTEME